MWIAILLGAIQGIVEWLPVSSEGAVAVTSTFALDRPLEEAVKFALWLHVGTVPSVLIALRREIQTLATKLVKSPRGGSPVVAFLLVATGVSGLIGAPILIGLEELSGRVGGVAMGVVGAFMLVTGTVQLRRSTVGSRSQEDVTHLDAVLAGAAQGVAVIPGLSRSGMTVAVLAARNFDRRDALILSFLMGVPASLAAALYAGFSSGLGPSREGIVAAAVAFVVGLVTIRALLRLVERVNFGWFVIAIGLVMILSASLPFIT